ncbi:hypothetical protein B0H14DRAFT_2583491 [Mycena olivaceomarginata]|nr:hypothetical protein B0H14DRAFT_2583491 [Mycena olivaceomarginata]
MHLHRFHNDAKKPCPAARDPSVLPIDVSPGASLVTQMSLHSGIQLKGRPPPRTAACTVTLLTALLSYAPRHNLNVFEDTYKECLFSKYFHLAGGALPHCGLPHARWKLEAFPPPFYQDIPTVFV